VSFDNLTIRRKNGVVRAVKEYYPYGLEYGRFNGSFAYNAIEMYNKGYSSATWHELEWKYKGLDLNYFAARYYDPIIGRWHAPDPLEQCHSPYTGMVNDPANFVDPDGRSAWMFLCGTAANGAGAYATAMNVTSTFRGTFSALGGVANFVTSGASVFAGLRGISTVIDFVNESLGFAQKHGNWSKITSRIYANATTSSLSAPADGGKDIEMTDGGIWIQDNVLQGKDGTALKVNYLEGKLVYQDGSAYTRGTSKYIDGVFDDLEMIHNSGNDFLSDRLEHLMNSKFTHLITRMANTPKHRPVHDSWEADKHAPEENRKTGSITFFYPDYDIDTELKIEMKNVSVIQLTHELLGHSYDYDTGTQNNGYSENGIKMYEVNAVNVENVARKQFGFDQRKKYGGKTIEQEELWDTHKK
jgi:RHS repeat-associated protein